MTEETSSPPFFETHHTRIYLVCALLCLIATTGGYFLTQDIAGQIAARAPKITGDGSNFIMLTMAALIPVFLILELLYRLNILRLPEKAAMLVILIIFSAPALLLKGMLYERFQVWMITSGYERCEAFDARTNGSSGRARNIPAWVQRGACEKYGNRHEQP